MNPWLEDIKAFHEKFGLVYNGKPRALPEDMRGFRENFIGEEYTEYRGHGDGLSVTLTFDPQDKANITHHLEEQLDALVDLMYVALGNVYLHGFGPIFDEAWRRVHEKNMAKVRAEKTGDSKRGSTFDAVKPPGWTPPSHTDLVEDHIHNEG